VTTGVLGLLGLGLRGGHVVIGVEGVRRSLQAGKLQCVVVASDASPRALQKVIRLAEAQGVPVVPGPTADEIGRQLGRPPVMVAGVRDRALAQGLGRLAREVPEEE
jgi:ribosomal protein L7Ae-like RNA K-turn-binding protein